MDTLHKIKLIYLECFNQELLDAVAETSIDNFFDKEDIYLRIKGYIYGKQLDKYEFKCPKNWIESFKERWYPRWLLKKYPVKYRKEIVDIKALYPTIKDIAGNKPVLNVTRY
ncbi:MAG: hypothetical protein ACFFG0_06310 [Candidatus Thorarchaeota archaeon]